MVTPMRKTLDMVAEMNRRAAMAGCAVRAHATAARRTHWDAIMLFGGDPAQQDRAARFLAAYYAAMVARGDRTALVDQGDVDAAAARRDWVRTPVRSGTIRVLAFCDETFSA